MDVRRITDDPTYQRGRKDERSAMQRELRGLASLIAARVYETCEPRKAARSVERSKQELTRLIATTIKEHIPR